MFIVCVFVALTLLLARGRLTSLGAALVAAAVLGAVLSAPRPTPETPKRGYESSGVDTNFVCEPRFPELTITSSQSWWERPYAPIMRLRFAGSFATPFHFEGNYCGSTCARGGDEVILDFQVPVPLWESTHCFDLLMQFVPETCELLAYMIIPVDSKGGPRPPSLLVSDVVYPNFGRLGLNPVPLVLRSSEDRVGVCAGHDLVSPEHGTRIPQGQAAVVGDYQVFNDGPQPHQDCAPTTRWIAVRMPPSSCMFSRPGEMHENPLRDVH